MRRSVAIAMSAVILIGAIAATAQSADPATSCESGKLKAAGKYASCLLSMESRAVKTNTLPDYSACVVKLGSAWQRAEDKGAGTCPGGDGDGGAIGAFVDACKNAVAEALAGSDTLPVPGDVARSFTDNGDGTVTDNVTGLTWEKLSDDGTIHDWDNTYSWLDAVAVKVGTLNSTGFGGHNDWRVPDRFELETLVNVSVSSPAAYSAFSSGCVSACAVAMCSCTVSSEYWSSTTWASNSTFAWYVDFNDGNALPDGGKYLQLHVRAVRGGS